MKNNTTHNKITRQKLTFIIMTITTVLVGVLLAVMFVAAIKSNFTEKEARSAHHYAECMSDCSENTLNANSAVATAGYNKSIENVRPGDTVKSYNQVTGKIENKRVLQTFENETDEITKITTSDGDVISSTPGHKFYANNKWVPAEDLRAGDILVSVNGEKVVVEQVQHEILETPIKVYNFEVQDNNTYLVGKETGVVVHNSGCHNKKIDANGNPVETHHIASDKSIKSGYTKKYKEIFDNTNMSLSDPDNLIDLPNHHGRHTNAYKDAVLDKITEATKDIKPRTKEYTNALKNALIELKDKLISDPSFPYKK